MDAADAVRVGPTGGVVVTTVGEIPVGGVVDGAAEGSRVKGASPKAEHPLLNSRSIQL